MVRLHSRAYAGFGGGPEIRSSIISKLVEYDASLSFDFCYVGTDEEIGIPEDSD